MSPATLRDGIARGHLAAGLVALVTLAGIVVLLVGFASGWWDGAGGSYAPRGLVVGSRITPDSSLFADPVRAQVDVTINPKTVDPASVQLTPNFDPFVVLSQSRIVQDGVGGAEIVHFRYEIECVSAPCIPLMTQRLKSGGTNTNAITLSHTKLTARDRDGTPVARSVAWPAFVLHSRLSTEASGFSTPTIASGFDSPRVSWRFSPNLLGGVAIALAVLLVLGAGALLATVIAGDTRRLLLWRRPPHLTPVERALRLAEHAARHDEHVEERKALERLAVELTQTGHGELAEQAQGLAWSASEPSSAALSSLAKAVRSHGANGANGAGAVTGAIDAE